MAREEIDMPRTIVSTKGVFSFIQTKQNSSGGSTSLGVTFDSPSTLNNLVVVNIKNSSAGTPSTVTDNVGNIYALAAQAILAQGNTNYISQYYGVQLIAGATVITVGFTTSVSSRVTIDEFSGGETTNELVFDTSARVIGGSATSSDGIIFSPSLTGELISSSITFSASSGVTAGPGYTLSTSNLFGSAQYKLSSRTSEKPIFTWVGSSTWGSVAGSYRAKPIPATRSIVS